MKRYALVFFALALVANLAFAQGAALFMPSDTEVQRAFADLILAGEVPYTNAFPYSGHELATGFGYSGKLAGPGFRSRLVFSIDPSVTGNSSTPSWTTGPGADPTLPLFIDSLDPFAELGARFSGGDSVAGLVKMDLKLRPDFFSAGTLIAPWKPSEIFRQYIAVWEFPQESWVSAASENAWIAAGRFKTGIGNGHFGSTFLNGRAEWYDQIQGVIHGKNLRFMSMLSSTTPHLYQNEADIQFKTDSDGTRYIWDPINDHDYVTTTEAAKFFAYHQIEARFFDRFRFGLGEMNLIGGKTPDLLNFMPGNFWHNAYTAGFSNVMINLDASLVPFKGLMLFGNYTLDDIKGPDEAADSKPTQDAWQAGGRYSFAPVDKFLVTIGGEYTHTSEWAYCRWQPYLTMYQRHLLNGGYIGVDYPLGFAYGPDADHMGAWLNVLLPKGMTVGLDYEHLIKGPISMGMIDSDGVPIYYDYDAAKLAVIRAKPDQISDSVGLSAVLPIGAGFEAKLKVQYTMWQNYGNVSGISADSLLYSGGIRWNY